MPVMVALTAFWWTVALGTLAFASWWLALALFAMRPPRTLPAPNGHRTRFVALVPAHNEEALIADCVRSLLAATDGFDVETVVIADNCTDATARAAAAAGATVVVRHDPALRGKPFALGFALSWLAGRGSKPDTVVFVDGDSTVAPNFFSALEHAYAGGAEAAQVTYLAAETPGGAAALRAFALGLVHRVRPLGMARLGLPTTLKGNGMALHWDLVAQGFPGEGLTEDASATLALASGGVTVTFVPGTAVRGAMPGSLRSIGAQDRRWEGGRLRLAPRAMHVAAAAIVRGRLRSAAAALEVAAPPLTLVGVGSSLAVVASVLGLVPAWLGAAPAVALTGYVMAGWLTLGARGSDISALAWAPLLIARKALTYATLVRPPASWQRTERD